MMDQTHIGYTYWQEPPQNAMPPVMELTVPEAASMGVAVEGANPEALPQFDVFNKQRHWADVFNRGRTVFEFSAKASAPWIVMSATHGSVAKEQRLWVSIDWKKVPAGRSKGSVRIEGAGAAPVEVEVDAFNPAQPSLTGLKGFIEASGYVSIEAEHYTRSVAVSGVKWERIPDYGRTLSAVSVFPVTAPSMLPPNATPCLEYRIYFYDAGNANVEAVLAPTQNFVPGRGLRYAISFDDEAPQVIDALANNSLRDWETTVKDSVRKAHSTHMVAAPGWHTLKFRMVDPGIVLEKLVVDLGGVRPSYLGPPESYRQ
jgi:hypothetical protein